MAKRRGGFQTVRTGSGRGRDLANPRTPFRSQGQELDVQQAFRGARAQIAQLSGVADV